MEVWLFGGIALIGLLIIVNFFSLSIKLLWNGIVGMVLLGLFNMVGSIAGLHLQINAITALVAGFFGVPGVILMLLYQMLSK